MQNYIVNNEKHKINACDMTTDQYNYIDNKKYINGVRFIICKKKNIYIYIYQ